MPEKAGDEKYKVVSPETMQETLMTDSEDEGGKFKPWFYLHCARPSGRPGKIPCGLATERISGTVAKNLSIHFFWGGETQTSYHF